MKWAPNRASPAFGSNHLWWRSSRRANPAEQVEPPISALDRLCRRSSCCHHEPPPHQQLHRDHVVRRRRRRRPPPGAGVGVCSAVPGCERRRPARRNQAHDDVDDGALRRRRHKNPTALGASLIVIPGDRRWISRRRERKRCRRDGKCCHCHFQQHNCRSSGGDNAQRRPHHSHRLRRLRLRGERLKGKPGRRCDHQPSERCTLQPDCCCCFLCSSQ